MRRAASALALTLIAVAGLGAQPVPAAGRCGSHPWCDTSLSPDARAALLLGVLTQDEKVSLLGGVDPTRIAGGAHTHTGASNGVARVDDLWFTHAVDAQLFDVPVQLCPAEEMMWSKGFVQERERFDGADVMHLIRELGSSLDWDRLLL